MLRAQHLLSRLDSVNRVLGQTAYAELMATCAQFAYLLFPHPVFAYLAVQEFERAPQDAAKGNSLLVNLTSAIELQLLAHGKGQFVAQLNARV